MNRPEVIDYKPILPFPELATFVQAVESGQAQFVDRKLNLRSFVNSSRHPLMKRLVKAIENGHPIKVEPNISKWMDLIHKYRTKYTMFASDIYFKFLQHEYCDLTFVPFPTRKRYLGLAFRKGSMLSEKFIAAMYGKGSSINEIFEQIVKRYLPPRRCSSVQKRSEMRKSENPYNLSEISFPIFIWIGAVFCGFVIFCLEQLLNFDALL